VLSEELLVLNEQLLELLDLVAFETPVPGHDAILARICIARCGSRNAGWRTGPPIPQCPVMSTFSKPFTASRGIVSV
jgi:hypothetical protein